MNLFDNGFRLVNAQVDQLKSNLKDYHFDQLENETLEIIHWVDQINQLEFLSKVASLKIDDYEKIFRLIILENWPTRKIIKLVNFPKLSIWTFFYDLRFSNWSLGKKKFKLVNLINLMNDVKFLVFKLVKMTILKNYFKLVNLRIGQP